MKKTLMQRSTGEQREVMTSTARRVPQEQGSLSLRLKCLISGLILACLVLLVVSLRLGITVLFPERKDPNEELNKNISLPNNKDIHCNILEKLNITTEKLNLVNENVICLRKAIYAAEWLNKCPSGWIFINYKCYFFSNEKKIRAQSLQFCESNGAKLATIKRQDTVLQSKCSQNSMKICNNIHTQQLLWLLIYS
ncbi:uncharacterized protein O3C94_004359 [Discoglossus pictus]